MPPERRSLRWDWPTRRALETALTRTVAVNRVTIAVVFPLVGVSLLVLGREGVLPSALTMNPYLLLGANIILISPLVAGFAPLLGRQELVGFGALTLFTWGIELVGVLTGVPYGAFAYRTALGPMLFGLVPLGLPVFFVPILLNSYLLAIHLLGPHAPTGRRFVMALAFVLAMDLVLDPGAVVLGFWEWTEPGRYYGVPASNYLGWIVSGSIGTAIVQWTFEPKAVGGRLERCPFVLDHFVGFLLFWGLVNLYVQHWIPVAIGLGFVLLLIRSSWFDFADRR